MLRIDFLGSYCYNCEHVFGWFHEDVKGVYDPFDSTHVIFLALAPL